MATYYWPPQATGGGGGTVTDVTATTPLFSSGGTTPNLTIQQASASQAGYLSAADWSTFNSKQSALSFPLAVDMGGTGLMTDPTDGQLLIGSTSGGDYILSTLTAGTGISITNASGSITIAATGTTLTFADSIVNSGGTVTLVNDSATPGNSKYYGTDSGGTLGYFSLPTPGTGTVTSVSVVPANGLAGTVATATTTPAITLSTSITGVLKGNGTAISAATAGTDYVVPSGSITGTAGNITASSNSTLTTLSSLSLPTTQLSGNIVLTSQVSGVLPIANGGTDNGSLAVTAGGVIYTDGTKLVNVGAGTSGYVLSSNGASAPTWIVNSPVFSGLNTDGVIYATSATAISSTAVGSTHFVLTSNGAGNAPTFQQVSLTTGVSGTLPTANGGTGTSSAGTQWGIPYYNTTTSLTSTVAGSSGSFLGANTGSAPTWQSLPAPTFSGLTQWAPMFAFNTTQITSTLSAGTTGQALLANTTSGPAFGALALGSSSNVTGTLALGNGGTGQTTASAAFNALSPITTTGDLILGTGTNTAGRLAIGTNTQVLTSNGTTASWQAATPSFSGLNTDGVIYATSSSAVASTTVGTAGQVLTSNGSGVAPTFQAIPTVNGFHYLASNTSVYGGTNSTLSFTGVDNTVVGVTSGNALTTGGTDNTLYGYQTGKALTSGTFNTIVGSLAGLTSTTDADNTFIGYKAGTVVNGASDNTLIGYEAGLALSTGGTNTIIGSKTVPTLTTGANNVLIGYNTDSLNALTSDSFFIGIGNSSDFEQGNVTASVSIGHQQEINGIASVCIGEGSQIGGAGAGPINAPQSVVIGASSNSQVTGGISIGYGVENDTGNYAISIGYESGAGGIGSVNLGRGIFGANGNNYSFSVGYSTLTPGSYDPTSAANQITFGTSTQSLKDMYLGNGAVAVAAPSNVSIQPTPATSTNTGADLTIGAGTSASGTAGSLYLKTAGTNAIAIDPHQNVVSASLQAQMGAWSAIGF